jgi:uncharacterized membrane protein
MARMHVRQKTKVYQVAKALGLMSLVSIIFFLIAAFRNASNQYWFLLWNLFLAWLPLIFAYGLLEYIKEHKWLSWQGIVFSALWLGFLPNSFYMVSDFIHLAVDGSGRVDLEFDVIMFTSFALTGLLIGYTSLYLVHKELLKRVKTNFAHLTLASVLFLCGFAIYLGRFLYWNTWDVIINPAGILFDVSDRLINIRSQPQMISTTLGFFILFGSIYAAIWMLVNTIQQKS